jgi:uncharacterized protein YecE (DUF72 family)
MSTQHKSSIVYIGCAGWTLPAAEKHRFPEAGSHLERYAARLPAVEINSSFYRPHRPATYARWAASVPASFRFSVKVPKTITHVHRLADVEEPLASFIGEVAGLAGKLGALLVQLPPGLRFDPRVAKTFFKLLRRKHAGTVLLEPRHATWFTAESTRMLDDFRIGRVAADPALVEAAAEPGGWLDTAYFRLHGSPRMYYSAYDGAYLDELAATLTTLAASVRSAWCIFDNTALGAATANAFELMQKLHDQPPAG